MHEDLKKTLREVGSNVEYVGRKLTSNREDYWSVENLEHMRDTLTTDAETIDTVLRIYKRRLAR